MLKAIKTGKQKRFDTDHAIVIGGSMAGLVAARVLSKRFKRVTIIERDPLIDDTEPRKGVPQGRHVHALLAGGATILEAYFPGGYWMVRWEAGCAIIPPTMMRVFWTMPVDWYIRRVIGLTASDPLVATAFFQVWHLLKPLKTLFSPPIVRAVLLRTARTTGSISTGQS